MDVFKVGVSVELIDRATHGLKSLANHLVNAQTAASDLHKSLHRISGSLIVGGGMMAMGGGIAAGMVAATKQAMQFDTALTAVKITGGFATGQMKELRQEIEKVSAKTAFSMSDIAGFAKTIEQGTGMSAEKLRSMLPMLSQFAGVMQFVKGANPAESVLVGNQFSELFGGFSAEAMQKNLDAFYKVSKATVATPSELLTSLRNFVPTGRTLGLTAEQSIMISGVLSNLGMTATGGASLNTLLSKVIPSSRMTAHGQSAAAKGMRALGLMDASGKSTIFDQSGHMDVMRLLAILGEAGKRLSPKDLAVAMHDVAGIRGARAGEVLADPKVQERLAIALDKLRISTGIIADHAELMKTPAMQFQVAMTDLKNVLINIGSAALPHVTKGLAFMADKISGIAEIMTPARAMALMSVLGALSGLLLLGGAAKSVVGLVELGKLVVDLGGMGIAISLLTNPVFAVTAGLGALYLTLTKLLPILFPDTPAVKAEDLEDKELPEVKAYAALNEPLNATGQMAEANARMLARMRNASRKDYIRYRALEDANFMGSEYEAAQLREKYAFDPSNAKVVHHHHGDMNFNVTQRPGEDGGAFVRRLANELHVGLLRQGSQGGVISTPLTLNPSGVK